MERVVWSGGPFLRLSIVHFCAIVGAWPWALIEITQTLKPYANYLSSKLSYTPVVSSLMRKLMQRLYTTIEELIYISVTAFASRSDTNRICYPTMEQICEVAFCRWLTTCLLKKQAAPLVASICLWNSVCSLWDHNWGLLLYVGYRPGWTLAGNNCSRSWRSGRLDCSIELTLFLPFWRGSCHQHGQPRIFRVQTLILRGDILARGRSLLRPGVVSSCEGAVVYW